MVEINETNLKALGTEFGNSLATSLVKYGSLTPKQAYWAEKLLTEAAAKAAGPKVLEVGKVAAMIAAAAAKGAKRIKFELGNEITAKASGGYLVAFQGKFPNGRLVAKINLATGEVSREHETVNAFIANPLEFAVKFGQLTGNCCFCGKGLETQESVGVGYGPVCANRYGLPWGTKAPFQQLKAKLKEAVAGAE